MSSSWINLENYLIPLYEIKRATENFSEERYIGGGGFGAVYKGQLSERWQCRTAAMISRFHHENIISFIGYCDEGVEMIIVYEYAMMGSLDHHLQDPNKMRCITWVQRLKICIEAARGLDYLHSGLGEYNRVIHRDVKSANILLDENMVAKICDFGLSKFGPRNQPDTQLYTKVAGTQFYLDPAYHESRILRKESDVYSFGVVLFEIMSGMLVYRERRIGDERQFLMNMVRRYHQNNSDKVIDPHIRDQIKSSSFMTYKEIAYQCISFNLMERPTLCTVITKIEEALINQLNIEDTDVTRWNMFSFRTETTPFFIKSGANSHLELVIKADDRVQEPKSGEMVRVIPRPSVLKNMSLEMIKDVFAKLPEAISLLAFARTADGIRVRYSTLYRKLAMSVPELWKLIDELDKSSEFQVVYPHKTSSNREAVNSFFFSTSSHAPKNRQLP
ncbi:hypothetical protein Lser_V15G03271 [Lactuca serriola]